jgi:hypothetical protein
MTIINVGLALVAFAAAAVSFTKETLSKGEGPLVTRVTPLGWIALVCIGCTLVLAVTKEVLESRENAALRQQLVTAQRRLNDSQGLIEARGRANDIGQKAAECALQLAPLQNNSGADTAAWNHYQDLLARARAEWAMVYRLEPELNLTEPCISVSSRRLKL